jgi:ABC-type phosphate/phosphonate transport system substrate-binding protein
MRLLILSLALTALATCCLLTSSASGEETPTPPVQIGMVRTLFADKPKVMIDFLLERLGAFLKEQTEVDGKVTMAGDALDLGKLLHENRYQLGFFYGIEFAWAQQKYSDLRPVMLVISKHRNWHAKLVAAKENAGGTFAVFRGKDLALPGRHKPHCRLFVEKSCARAGQCDPKAFFSHITHPESVEDALDSVLLGQVQAAIVDERGWEHYQSIKPGSFARLKVIEESEAFPPGVIAYRAGGLAEPKLGRFRAGLVNAAKSPRGRDTMALFGITSFDEVPGDFDQTLAAIRKAYPAPAADGKEKRR